PRRPRRGLDGRRPSARAGGLTAPRDCPACGGPLGPWRTAPAWAPTGPATCDLARCGRCGSAVTVECSATPGAGAGATTAAPEPAPPVAPPPPGPAPPEPAGRGAGLAAPILDAFVR